MPPTIDIPAGTVFNRLTVIEEARTSDDRRAMLCLCECGQQTITAVSKLRAGTTKSCGCLRYGEGPDPRLLKPGEVPLYGKKAAGRVALVDEADYDLVMQYRWNVKEDFDSSGKRIDGPYARTTIYLGVRRSTPVSMHQLLTGFAETDHWDGNGLNNQRSNLRDATHSQNNANQPKRSGSYSSQFKGVSWYRKTGRWQAYAHVNRHFKFLGYFDDEAAAARAYDAAALETWGEFARLNFSDGAERQAS